jgi:NAD(P)-dependent dehydrogenase (short-subunit alcohol dehydrogenase family)
MSATSITPAETVPRVALITGASRGLGAALSEALAGRGWHVVAVARTVGALEDLDDRIKSRAVGTATLSPIDLTQDDALRHLCRSIHERWGHVDLWAHTAIQAPPLSPAGHVAVKDWDRALAVGLRATGVLIPMVEPLLRAAPQMGRAVFFDDPACRDAQDCNRAHFGAYGAVKSGQMALAQAWAAENAALGPERAPQVSICAPSPMPTGTRARFFPGEPADRLSPCATEARRCLDSLGL